MHVTHVVSTDFVLELPDGFEEREDLDVTDRATDLGDHDIDIIGREPLNTALDLVGDVWDDLYGPSQVVTASLRGEDRLVDAASGRIRRARKVLVDETLVVTEIEIGLATVVSDEHFSVLEWIHRARVDVDVRIELLHRDSKATHLEQATK